MDFAMELERLLRSSASRLGRGISLAGVRQYAAERMAHLATIVGEPGYDEALIAERDSVALQAGLKACREGDAVDAELVGMIGGVLGVGARALAGGPSE